MTVAIASYELTVASVAPPEAVFAVLADATRWHEWAGVSVGTSVWEREGDPAPGGVGAIRRLGRWPAFGREQTGLSARDRARLRRRYGRRLLRLAVRGFAGAPATAVGAAARALAYDPLAALRVLSRSTS